MKKPVILSLIIPCFNAERYIARCLDSILASKFSAYEIIVVDDHSQDQSPSIIRQYQPLPQIKAVFLNQNQGPAQARNIGTRLATGNYLFFLDIDTKIAPNCLNHIVAKLESSPKVGAIQACLETGGHFLTFFGFPYEIPVSKQEKLIFGARSAGLAIRKKLFEKIGGFDEDYFIYGEDTDLSWRVWLAGYQVIFLPQAKVYHFQKSSLTPKTQSRLFYEGAKNSTSNLLKNAPLKLLILMLPLHLLAWLVLSWKLLLQKRPHLAFCVYRGLGWNLVNLRKTLDKRRKITTYTAKNNQALRIMFGKITPKELFLKGLKWFWYV